MEKRVKHLGNCKLVTSKGSSCAEPCMLSQYEQEFKAEEWPVVVQMVHQAYAKAGSQCEGYILGCFFLLNFS